MTAKRKQRLGAALLLCAWPLARAVAQDSIQLDTYYPSPRGVYQQMRISNDAYLAQDDAAAGVVVIGSDGSVAVAADALLTLKRAGADVFLDLDTDAAHTAGLRLMKDGMLQWEISQDPDPAQTLSWSYQGQQRFIFDGAGPFVVQWDQDPKLRLHDPGSGFSSLQAGNTDSGTAAGDGFWLSLTAEENGLLEQKEQRSMLFTIAGNEILRISPEGYAAMGTTTPDADASFHVVGGYVAIQDPLPTFEMLSGSGADWRMRVNAGGTLVLDQENGGVYSTQMSFAPNGNVGLHTDSPAATLHIAPSGFDPSSAVVIRSDGSTPELNFQRNQGGAYYYQNFYVDGAGMMGLWNGAFTTNLRFHADGSFGVGYPPTPDAGLLRVGAGNGLTGDMRIRGTYYCNQTDLSETFDWSETGRPIEAGDVVVVDRLKDESIALSAGAYADTVAGVVATDPGMQLGGREGLALALVGRVPAKATAENGPIRRGDLLVSATKPGYAMRADADGLRPGMVIGKAMTELEAEEGVVVVFVNLQ